jgi:excisionase family DNA binding protein
MQPQGENVHRMLLTPEQAAKALGIGRTKLYQVLRSGHLQSVRIGGSRRISIQALEAYVSSLGPPITRPVRHIGRTKK